MIQCSYAVYQSGQTNDKNKWSFDNLKLLQQFFFLLRSLVSIQTSSGAALHD